MKKKEINRKTFLADMGKTIFYAGIGVSIYSALDRCTNIEELHCSWYDDVCSQPFDCPGSVSFTCDSYDFGCPTYTCPPNVEYHNPDLHSGGEGS